jgi:hypothetical protein
MAEITKLSVHRALSKLSRPDRSDSKIALEGEALHEEVQRLRGMKRRLQPNKAAALIGRDPRQTNAAKILKLLILVGSGAMVVAILASKVLS